MSCLYTLLSNYHSRVDVPTDWLPNGMSRSQGSEGLKVRKSDLRLEDRWFNSWADRNIWPGEVSERALPSLYLWSEGHWFNPLTGRKIWAGEPSPFPKHQPLRSAFEQGIPQLLHCKWPTEDWLFWAAVWVWNRTILLKKHTCSLRKITLGKWRLKKKKLIYFGTTVWLEAEDELFALCGSHQAVCSLSCNLLLATTKRSKKKEAQNKHHTELPSMK